MNKNKLLKLKHVINAIKNRNIEPLKNYNTGKLIHKKQLEFHKSTKRNRWVFGGNRTGKTECGAIETIWLSLGIHPYKSNKQQTECWVVSLSRRVQKEVAQSKILKYLPINSIVDITMTEGKKTSPESGIIECILVKNKFGNTSKIWFKSCEEGREKFQGASLDFVWFDEEPPEDIYRECQMRVLDKKGEIFGTMTPLKGLTFIYDEIYLNSKQDPETFYIFISWNDNPFLKPEEIDRLSKTLSNDEIESRKHGRFSAKDCGLIYTEFDENINVIKPFNLPQEWQDMISIDPGLHNPLSCHWYARDYDDNIYVVAEHYAENKTLEYHSSKIIEISNKLNWKKASNGMYEALIDSAANQKTLASTKSVSELFYDNGILVNPNVNKDVLSGISKVKSYLKNIHGKSRLFIFENCTNLIREIKQYRWNGHDAPIKSGDHSLDELRYYIMHLNQSKSINKIKSDIQKDKERLIKNLKRNHNVKK